MPFRSPNLLLPAMALIGSVACGIACIGALAQTPDYNNVGKTPSAEEIRAWDISINTEGKGLPPGRGTAKEGAKIFAQRCAKCHGPDGTKVIYEYDGTLVGGKGTLTSAFPLRTIGSFYPYATTAWDYIRRAMPLKEEGSLSADEVYAVTAFVLYKNDIIKEDDAMDAETLPKVQMPNRNGFLPPLSRWQEIRRFRCPIGSCP